MHRVLLAPLLAAVTFIDDEVYSNAHYESVGGVGLNELNKLEYAISRALEGREGGCATISTRAAATACDGCCRVGVEMTAVVAPVSWILLFRLVE